MSILVPITFICKYRMECDVLRSLVWLLGEQCIQQYKEGVAILCWVGHGS